MSDVPAYLVFDIETVVDREFMHATMAHPGESIDQTCTRVQAEIQTYRDPIESMRRFMTPVCWSAIVLTSDLRRVAHSIVGCAASPVERLSLFWAAYQWVNQASNHTCKFVTFGGTRFDFPVMAIQAMRAGVDTHGFFVAPGTKAWEDPRRMDPRFFDLSQYLGYGGSLDFWARTFGFPGKIDHNGGDVQQMLLNGQCTEVEDYCAVDVLNTVGALRGVLRALGQGPVALIDDNFRACVDAMASGRGPELQKFRELFDQDRI